MQEDSLFSGLEDAPSPQEDEKPAEIVVIFHPGKGMTLNELKKHIKELERENLRIRLEFYVEAQRREATLVSPIGVFSGKRGISDGLAALKYIFSPAI